MKPRSEYFHLTKVSKVKIFSVTLVLI